MPSDKQMIYQSHLKLYNSELKSIANINKTVIIHQDSSGRLYYAQRSYTNRNKNNKNKEWKAKKLLKLTHVTNNKLVFSGYGSSGFTENYHEQVTRTMIKGKGTDGFISKTVTRLDGKKTYSTFYYK